MKNFEQLTKTEQVKAVKASMCWLVTQIVSGVLDVDLINQHNNSKLKNIMSERWKNDAPRLAMMRILHDKAICGELIKLATIDAEESQYTRNGSHVRGDILQ